MQNKRAKNYIPVSTDVTIAAGTTSTTLTVQTIDDEEVEDNEDFTVSITGSTGGGFDNVTIANDSVTTTIIDNDEPPPEPVNAKFSDTVNDKASDEMSVLENVNVVFTVAIVFY